MYIMASEAGHILWHKRVRSATTASKIDCKRLNSKLQFACVQLQTAAAATRMKLLSLEASTATSDVGIGIASERQLQYPLTTAVRCV